MAVEAILAACADAGIAPREIDGVVRYDMESTDEEQLLSIVGPGLRYQASTSWGGGGSVSVLVHAAIAIAMGMANHVLVFRSRARGKNSVFYFPIATCILISVVLSLILWLLSRGQR